MHGEGGEGYRQALPPHQWLLPLSWMRLLGARP